MKIKDTKRRREVRIDDTCIHRSSCARTRSLEPVEVLAAGELGREERVWDFLFEI